VQVLSAFKKIYKRRFKMELKIRDKVKLNSTYFEEGLAYFGKELKYPRNKDHYFIIKNIKKMNHENYNLIFVDGGNYKEIDYISDKFLELIY
jgi:hypothetical protein